MRELTAIVRMERKGNVQSITRDYFASKKRFKSELKSNGCIVLAIYTPAQIQKIKNQKIIGVELIQEQYVRELL